MPEIWTQTFITVTPKKNSCFRHRDVEVQQIQAETTISANVQESFTISKEDFIPKPSPRHLVDPKELEQKSTKDAENQTFLQGVPTVTIPIQQKDEASQTTYMRGHPSKRYSLLMTSMNVKPPVFKNDCSSQTEIGIPPRTPQHEVAKYLSNYTHDKQPGNPSKDPVDLKTIIHEIINFLLSRTLWISDPDLYQIPIETTCQETQTVIRYNRNTNSIVMDSEIQTKLTCKPRYSNSKLLAEYEETKSFVQNCLQECFKGIESRVIIDELIDEIIAKGADRLKYPACDQMSQTVASYRSHEIKEKDVLRKLRIPVIVDPLEASTIVVPLMDDLLRSTCDEVSRNARRVVKDILNSSIQQTITIRLKLERIRKQLRPKSIEEILNQRRKKIIESMLKKETETTATQTGLAGVPVVAKIKEPEDVLCSVCIRQSICHWCRMAQEEDTSLESTKLLRTQDILLAYKPCYVVATASEEAKNPHLQSTVLMKKHEKLNIQLPASQSIISKKIGDVKTIKVLMTPKKNLQDRDSISEWARIIDDTLAKSWSFKESAVSNTTNVTITSFAATAISETCCKKTSQSESVPSLQVMEALQILKNTFCTRDSCPAKILKRNRLLDKRKNKEPVSCNLNNCTLLNLDQCPKRSVNKIDCQICARPRADKFRTVPVQNFTKFRGQI